MQLRFGLVTVLSVFSLVGCSLNNGSLDYKNAATTTPLKYPEGAMVRPATPLYPAPSIEQLALDHAPNVENAKGNRFALPRPTGTTVAENLDPAEVSLVGRPQPLVDGNTNPLLKIDGQPTEVWKYLIATLNSLNFSIQNQDADRYEATIQIDGTNYLLKLTPLGSSNSLAVFTLDHRFADQQQAADLLAQIYQNWPA